MDGGAADDHDCAVQIRNRYFTWLAGLMVGVGAVMVGVVLGLGVSRLIGAGAFETDGVSEDRSWSGEEATGDSDGDVGAVGGGGDTPAAARPMPFAVAWGYEGTVLTDGAQLTPLSNATFEQLRSGAFGAQVGDDHAVVVTPDELHLIDRSGQVRSVDCVGCMGVAVDDGEIVTAHRPTTDDDSFALEVFDDRLTPLRTIAAPRVGGPSQFEGGSSPAPAMLAASDGRFTVSYLSADAIEEGGPSVVAQYSAEGEPLAHLIVEGTVDQASVSPDAGMLAIAVARGYDTCDPPSRPFLLQLDGLEEVKLGEPVPPELEGSGLSFRTTDLHWDGEVLIASGQVSRDLSGSTEDDPCDAQPGLWRLRYDRGSDKTSYSPGGPLLAQRLLGEDCATSISIHAAVDQPTLVGSGGGDATELGEYRELALGAPPSSCQAQPEALPSTWPGNAATDIYFVGQLYDGSLSLPGLADDGATALSSPVLTPKAMKLGSGVMWNLGSWTGWGTKEATAQGTFTDHTDFESEGTVVLSQPKMCGSSLMYSRIEQRWDQPMPSEIASYTPATIDIEGCR